MTTFQSSGQSPGQPADGRTGNPVGSLQPDPIFPEKIREGFVLVLSGGVIRGAGHLGFLAACREYNLPVRGVVGTSAGAIAGAVFQSGKFSIEDAQKRLKTLRPWDMFRLRPRMGGFLDSGHTADLLGEIIGPDTTFSDLRGPLAVAAVSLETRNLVLLQHGPVARSVAASSALPPFFSPLRLGGIPYVDGGLLSVLPVMAARTLYPEAPLVAVNVNDREDRQTVPGVSAWLEYGPSRGTGRPISWNMFFHPFLSLGMELLWITRMESSFSDWYVGISAGRYSLLDRGNLDRIFRLGYDSGVRFSSNFRPFL
ncbi:MAG: patatin-like phospholipase family protein [Nitrospirae bacterium]|jgi:NTE family protein|nr:patatin-like phospholipase family protein [Nitrospirota bacterium]